MVRVPFLRQVVVVGTAALVAAVPGVVLAATSSAVAAAPTISVTVPPQPITSTRDVAVTYSVSLKPSDLKLLECGLTLHGSSTWVQRTCGIRTDINRRVTGSITFQGVADGTYDVVVRAQGRSTALGEKRVVITVAYVAPSSIPAQACAPYGTFLAGGDMSAFPSGSGFDDATYAVRWRCSGGASTFQVNGVLTSAGNNLLLVCLNDGGQTAVVWPITGPQVFYCLNLR